MKKINPVLFALIFLCSFLPFVHLSCDNREVMEISLFQFSTGLEVQLTNLGYTGNSEMEKINPEPLAITILVIIISGFLFSFLPRRSGSISSIIFSILGLIFLFSFKAKIDNESIGAIEIDYGIGFWSIWLLFLVIGILNFYFLLSKRKEEISFTDKTSLKFCPYCGYGLTGDEIFCPNCGKKLKE
jgi:uncharacterized membrane protein